MYKIVINLDKKTYINIFKKKTLSFLNSHCIDLEKHLYINVIDGNEDYFRQHTNFNINQPIDYKEKVIEMSPDITNILKFNEPITNFKHLIQDSFTWLDVTDKNCLGFNTDKSYSLSMTCDSDQNINDNLDDRLLFKIVSKHYDKNCWGYYKII